MAARGAGATINQGEGLRKRSGIESSARVNKRKTRCRIYIMSLGTPVATEYRMQVQARCHTLNQACLKTEETTSLGGWGMEKVGKCSICDSGRRGNRRVLSELEVCFVLAIMKPSRKKMGDAKSMGLTVFR